MHTEYIGLLLTKGEEIYAWAVENHAIIITFDDDFTHHSFVTQKKTGIIRLNVWPTTFEETKIALERLIENFLNSIFNSTKLGQPKDDLNKNYHHHIRKTDHG